MLTGAAGPARRAGSVDQELRVLAAAVRSAADGLEDGSTSTGSVLSGGFSLSWGPALSALVSRGLAHHVLESLHGSEE